MPVFPLFWPKASPLFSQRLSRLTLALFPALVATQLAFAPAAQARPPEALLETIRKAYHPEVSSVVTKQTTFGIADVINCSEQEVEIMGFDPITQKPRKVYINVYWPEGTRDPESLRTILVHPPTGGANKLDMGFANASCFLGFRIAVVKRWDYLEEFTLDLELHDRAALRELVAIRHVIDYLNPQRPNQIGILGTSRGAIAASVAVSIDDRLASAALIAGGGNLAQIIAESKEETMTKLREARKTAFDFKDTAAYQKALEKAVHYEPLEFLDLAPTKQIWMMEATRDNNVPTHCQQALALGFGLNRLDLNFHDDDHVPTIINTFLTRSQDIIAFFNRTLR